MRILYVADSLMAGGIESQLVELLTHLDRTRFAPHLLCLYGPHARDLHFAPVVQAARIPLVLPDLGWRARDKLRAIATIAATARATRPHLIQAEGYHANLLTRLAFPFVAPAKLIGSLRGEHTAKQMAYERLSHWTCTRIVVNAPQLKAGLVARGHMPARKIEYIPNGIACDRFAQPHDPSLRDQIAPGARRVIVSIGRISFEKNMHWIAEALGLLKRQGRLPADVRAIIAGPVQDDGAQAALLRAIQHDDLEGIVIQCPATEHPEDYYYMGDATILYTPSEGLSNVSLESLAAGRPVLISNTSNAAGVVTAGQCGWVVPTNDIASLADTLHTIFSMPDEALARMRQACRDRAQEFGVATMVQRYTAMYDTLVPSLPRERDV